MVRVEIGAWDWQRPDWVSAYYPADLPHDWRPAYYANEYACVGLPPETWQSEDLSIWQQETGEEFLFWVGCGPRQLRDPALVDTLAMVGPRLAGVYFEKVDQTQTDALIERLKGRVSSAVFRAEPALPGIPAPWYGVDPGGPAALNIYHPQPGDNVRQRRALLERYVAAPGPDTRYLLVAGAPDIAEECRHLCALLGI